jgi:hypothetical protein
MMRKWSIGAGVAVLSLALASAALAVSGTFVQVANVGLTAHKTGQSTGINSDLHSSDASQPGNKPVGAKTVVITFPAKTKFNLATPLVKKCTVPMSKLTALVPTTCPKSSQIGTGSAVVNASPIYATINAGVKAYVRNSKTIILVVTTGLAAPQVIAMTVSGAKLSIPVPNQSLGNTALVLTSLKLTTKAIGTGKKALMTAGKCVAHKFTVNSHFVYLDGSTLDIPSTSACSS